MWYAVELAAGLVLLYAGAEWLVKGASGLGRAFGVQPLLIGVTVVAYGTSLPELVVSTLSAVKGMSDIAVGNVVGSNIANLGLILGATALISPLSVDGGLVRRELPVMVAAALLLPLLLAGGTISRLEAAFLLTGAVGFTWLAAHAGLRDSAALDDSPPIRKPRLAALAVLGLVVLVAGGHVFVTGAAGLAAAFGVSQRIIGLTIAAVGTSLPELATSVVAALRGHPSIAVGNVIGSNIFNIFFVLGGAAAVRPVTGSLIVFASDVEVLLAMSILAAFFLRRKRVLRRWEGGLLLASYAAYVALLLRG